MGGWTNPSVAAGGTITGALTITGNLTVQGTTTSVVNQTVGGTVDISSGALSLTVGADTGATTRTDATTKIGRFCGAHYTNAQEPVAIVSITSDSGASALQLGGGSSLLNAATSIQFFTAANNTTTTGTQRVTIDSAGVVTIDGSIRNASGARWVLLDAAATATVPNIVQNFSDQTTGIGGVSGTISLITGGSQRVAIDSAGDTAFAGNVAVTNAAATTGIVLDVNNANALTTGQAARFQSNSADASGRNLVLINNQNSAAVGATALQIQQQSNARGLFLNQDGNGVACQIVSEATTADVIEVQGASLTTGDVFQCTDANALTTGQLMRLNSDSADVTSRNLFTVVNDNSAAVGTRVMHLRQDAANRILDLNQTATVAGSSFINFLGTEAANVTGPISSHPTAGTIQEWAQCEMNGTKRWVPLYDDPSA